jgi:xyloglucan-specific exo-beta-1,4-glucanase
MCKKFYVQMLGILGALLTLAFALAPADASAQQYTWRNVEIVGGGYVPGLVFNTSERDLIYARTDIGGAYRWNPTTKRWIPLLDWIGFDDWNLTGVDSIATDPVDPNRLYILAGTYTNAWTSQNGAILRSTDRGNTFTRTNLPFKSGGNMPGRNMGERLAIDPNRNATLYLGARSGNGLWRSTDFGATWSRVTSFTATGTYVQDPNDPNGYLTDPIGVTWVVFDKRTGTAGNATQTIYVGVADLGTSIYRSTNGGTTWTALPGQPTGYMPHHAVLASNGILYVTYSNKGGPYDGEKGDVWKFDTATSAWTQISPVPSSSSDNYFGYGGLSVDAQNPNTLMVAALNSWWPDTILFRSRDAGATWTRIWDWAAYPERTLRYTQNITAAPWLVFTDLNPVAPVPSPKLGWMVGDLEIDPFNSNRLMYGTGATIYGTENLLAWDAGNQIAISVMAQGLEETAVLDLISPPAGAPLISGLGDINGFRHDSLTTPPSRMFNSPSFAASSLDYAELSPSFIVRVGNVDRAANPTVNRIAFSFDGGTNWFQASSEPGGVNGPGTVAAAANAGRVLWSPSGTTPQVSTNNGSSWTASTGIPTGAVVEADRVNPMKFYGLVNGTFYVSTNGGASFTAAATGLPTTAKFRAVPGIEGDIWLAGGAEGALYGIWHSTNSGATFTKLTNVEEADNIGMGMAASGQTYPALYSSAQVGGVRGIYRSIDAGATWTRINDDQHQYASTGGAISGDPRVFGRVYLSTNGRGIIYGEQSGTTPTTPTFTLSANPSSVTVNRSASGTATINIARTSFTTAVAFSISGLPAGVTATFSPTSATGASTTVTLNASATAATGPATLTITGTGGSLTRTTTLALTVNGGGTDPGPGPGTGTGGVTATPAVTGSSPWFGELQLRVNNTAPLTALSVTIVVQRTAGVNYAGQYNTLGGTVQQSNNSTASAVTYQYTLAAGQTLAAGTNRSFAAQFSGNGTVHPTSGDSYTVTYTTGGQSFTQTGTF